MRPPTRKSTRLSRSKIGVVEETSNHPQGVVNPGTHIVDAEEKEDAPELRLEADQVTQDTKEEAHSLVETKSGLEATETVGLSDGPMESHNDVATVLHCGSAGCDDHGYDSGQAGQGQAQGIDNGGDRPWLELSDGSDQLHNEVAGRLRSSSAGCDDRDYDFGFRPSTSPTSQTMGLPGESNFEPQESPADVTAEADGQLSRPKLGLSADEFKASADVQTGASGSPPVEIHSGRALEILAQALGPEQL